MDNLNLPKAKQLVNNLLNKSKHKDFLIGISGGIDSLVLLSLINELKLTYDYNFRAIHINHNFSSNSVSIGFAKRASATVISKLSCDR